MALKILAHPVDDKRKASVITTTYDSGWDVIDIRGFANFTIMVTSGLTGTAHIMVNDAETGTFSRLYGLGTSAAAAITTIPVAVNQAYDVPELAGCHYLTFSNATAGTIKIMGKV
tara:strand:- start:493 stop:837 length:345 start_codon:yes stop_codon:yes gene_type:complete